MLTDGARSGHGIERSRDRPSYPGRRCAKPLSQGEGRPRCETANRGLEDRRVVVRPGPSERASSRSRVLNSVLTEKLKHGHRRGAEERRAPLAAHENLPARPLPARHRREIARAGRRTGQVASRIVRGGTPRSRGWGGRPPVGPASGARVRGPGTNGPPSSRFSPGSNVWVRHVAVTPARCRATATAPESLPADSARTVCFPSARARTDSTIAASSASAASPKESRVGSVFSGRNQRPADRLPSVSTFSQVPPRTAWTPAKPVEPSSSSLRARNAVTASGSGSPVASPRANRTAGSDANPNRRPSDAQNSGRTPNASTASVTLT